MTDRVLTVKAQSMPIAKHHPVTKELSPQQKTIQRVRQPNLSSPSSSDSDEDFEDWALEIYEWLSLVTLESPRICLQDTIDPFLSRYQVPNNESETALNLVMLTWSGLIPASWIRKLLICLSR